MPNEKRKTPGSAEASQRRRPPTIDATAKEIAPDPVEERSGAEPVSSEQDRSASASANEIPTDRSNVKKPGNGSPPRASGPSRMFYGLAALAAAVAVVALLFAAQRAGMIAIYTAGAIDAGDRIERMETQLRTLEQRASAAPDSNTLDAKALDAKIIDVLNARIGKLEQALGKISTREPADGDRLTAVDGNLKSLGLAIAGLNRRIDEVAVSATTARARGDAAVKTATELRAAIAQIPQAAAQRDVTALRDRIAALETAAKTTIANTTDTASLGAGVRHALSALALREAVAVGVPFAAELEAVKSTGGTGDGDRQIEALAPFAAAGIPTDRALAAELTALIPAMKVAAGIGNNEKRGILERFQANAEKLVRVRRINEASGDDVVSAIVRIEHKVAGAGADVAGVRAEIVKLPNNIRQIAEGWVKKLDARHQAIAAARTLSASAIRALAKP